MTEKITPRLGQGAGVAAEVHLLPGEIPLSAWDALFYASWWRGRGGVLYLTSLRLVWISWRPSLPWIPRVVSIALENIERVWTRLVIFSPFIGLAGPFHRQVVVDVNGSGRHAFSPAATGTGAYRVAGEINSILRERGLLRD